MTVLYGKDGTKQGGRGMAPIGEVVSISLRKFGGFKKVGTIGN